MINEYEYNLEFIPNTSIELKEKHKYKIKYNRSVDTVKDFIDLIDHIKFKTENKFSLEDYSVLVVKTGTNKIIDIINLQI